MARAYAQVKIRIWADPDFRALPVDAQHLYLMLVTAPSLSFAGVADWRPARLAPLVSDWTPGTVTEAAKVLRDRLYIITDDETEEVLVRTFIKHDGLIKRATFARACASAYAVIASTTLRGVVVHELLKLHEDEPSLDGWPCLAEVLTQPAIDPRSLTVPGEPSSQVTCNNGSPPDAIPADTAVQGEVTPLLFAPSTLHLAPNTAQPGGHPPKRRAVTADNPDFKSFWAVYPKKVGKGHALQAWNKAIKDADPQTIIRAAKVFAETMREEDQKYLPHPSTWLNGARWTDEPAPLSNYDKQAADPANAWLYQ